MPVESIPASDVPLAAVLGLFAAGANVLGGYLIVRREWSGQWLKYFVALASGFMLAVAFLEMLPESLALLGEPALAFALLGYLFVHFFEHTLAPHFHFGEETHREELASAHASYAALLGLTVHAFFDGVAIGAGFVRSAWLGSIVFLAVFLHKLPEGFTVASLMLASGRSRRAALSASLVLAAATLVGMLLIAVLASQVRYALPLSAGVTIYVAASDLMPEVNREPGTRLALVVFLGVAIMAALHFLFRAHVH
ncbi:MAG: ZIP family metal transporter [Acidobacteriia bacterium]|jgi:ZIP family zinc transporter/zinc and cadmium transporter|nr:ZIP family metal transporter [Terriglobia bacterium]